jgi:4-amino-4-deoxy-L-arabinose transferase-like glycosyltransferase
MPVSITVKRKIQQFGLPIAAILSIAVGLYQRWLWQMSGRIPFNSDEAIVGLMARHILAGERPTFFYGQAYMGSLDAWLNAAGFSLWGQSIASMRLVQSILWIGLLVSVFFLARRLFQSTSAGWVSLILFGLPPVNQVLYGTVTLGGYNEALIIGCWCLFLTAGILAGEHPVYTRLRFVGLGLLAGFGLWVFGFSLVFSLPAVGFTLPALRRQSARHRWFNLGCLLLGGLIGAWPWWAYAVQHGIGPLLIELTGSAVAVERTNWFSRTFTHLFSMILLGIPAGLGFRPPWSAQWILLPLLPVALIIWLVITIQGFRLARTSHLVALLLSVPLTLFVLFIFTSFGVDPSGRYFLPLGLILSIQAGGILCSWRPAKMRWIIYVMAGILVIYQGYGAVRAVIRSEYGLTTQFAPNTSYDAGELADLIGFLHDHDLTTGYTDYWTAYPLDFMTGEELTFIPRLPYHENLSYTVRDDRYAAYTAKVYNAGRNVYITRNNPALDDYLVDAFGRAGVDWEEANVGRYHIYYQLSKYVTPEELGLGQNSVEHK